MLFQYFFILQGTELLFKMNDDSQMLLAVYSGVMDGTCTLAQAMEIVVTLGSEGVIAAAPSTSKSVSAPSSSSAGGGMDLLDFIDSTVSESRSVQSTHALLGPTTNFYVTPPLSTVSSSTNYDPFGSDPFGPGDSSIDDLLGSTPTVKSTVIDQFSTMSDNFTSSQSQVQRPTHSTPADALDSLLLTPNPNPKPPVLSPYLGMSPATGTSKHLVDLNALIFSENTNTHVGLSGNNGYNQAKVQGYNLESQPPQPLYPYETYTSLATVPTPPLIQSSYQPHLQTSVQYNNQFQQMSSLSQPFQQSTYGIRSDSTGPPPLPSSPPPPVPQQQQQNPFDSF